tara:strand:- start:702 stop:1328 length:627 start_codon:yes stop_codon:yes gene_type:complete
MENTKNEDIKPVNEDEGFIKQEMHQTQKVGTLSSNGFISPTVGKPNKSTWFMSHPDYELELTLCQGRVGANGVDRIYLVQGEDPTTQDKLIEGLDGVFQANCVLTCSTGGHHSIWPVKVGSEDNVHIAHSTARNALDASKKDFIKLWYKGNDVGYEWKHPENPELYAKKIPVWPKEQSWMDILGKAFKTQTISNLEHPVYLTAVGKHI